MDTLKQLQEKALHTAKLVPQSQRDLFIFEIETITTLAFEAGKAEAIADYQTNYEQKHIVSAIDLKEKETLAMVLKEIENSKEKCTTEYGQEVTEAVIYNQALDTLKTKLTAKE